MLDKNQNTTLGVQNKTWHKTTFSLLTITTYLWIDNHKTKKSPYFPRNFDFSFTNLPKHLQALTFIRKPLYSPSNFITYWIIIADQNCRNLQAFILLIFTSIHCSFIILSRFEFIHYPVYTVELFSKSHCAICDLPIFPRSA